MVRLANLLASIGEFTHFAWQALVASVVSVVKPGPWLQQLYAVLVGSLPLGTVAGIALGAVVWMHTHAALARTGALITLPTVLAAAVLLELAPDRRG